MLQNWVASWFAGMAASKLSGYKTKIGAACLILYGVVCVAGKMYPDLNLPGGTTSWSDDLGIIGAGLTGLGLLHKTYKMGLNTSAESVASLTAALESAKPSTSLADADAAAGVKV